MSEKVDDVVNVHISGIPDGELAEKTVHQAIDKASPGLAPVKIILDVDAKAATLVFASDEGKNYI